MEGDGDRGDPPLSGNGDNDDGELLSTVNSPRATTMRIEQLQLQLSERNDLIDTLKEKTKSYIHRQQEEHQTELTALQNRLLHTDKELVKLQAAKSTLEVQVETLTKDFTDFRASVANDSEKNRCELMSMKEKVSKQLECINILKDGNKEFVSLNQAHKGLQNMYEQLEVQLQNSVLRQSEGSMKMKMERNTLQEEHEVMKQKELEVNQEIKSKTKAYISFLVVEQKNLQDIAATLRAEIVANADSFQQKEYELKNEYETTLKHFQYKIEQYQTELEAKENAFILYCGNQDTQKDIIQNELEVQKAKRMTARSEIISMAHITENIQQDMKEVKHTLKTVVTPLVNQHISDLETLLTHLEMVNTYLTSSSSSSSKLFVISPLSENSRTNGSSPNHHGLTRSFKCGEGTVSSETFSSLDILQYELQRCAMGITLLQSAMLRLAENAQKRYEKENCCISSINNCCSR